MAAGGCSVLMLATYRPATAAVGFVVDLLLIAIISGVPIPHRAWVRPRTGVWAKIGRGVVFAALVYVAVVIVARPWHSRWGSSDGELRAALPGDDLVPNARYTIQHAVTIRAAPEAIWPWLVQLGQDRGGFYSYDWLERAVGDEVRNADRIHPEWQTLATGDLVRLDPQRALGLGGWGAFVLEPKDGYTRLIVRTRGAGTPNVALAPFGLLVFEPAHFIMERRMLLGIKERAERRSVSTETRTAVSPATRWTRIPIGGGR